jgi:putative Mn2+ efflux pump MntP
MEWNVIFFLDSLLLGFALSLDAFSVSITNTLREQKMPLSKMNLTAFCYAFFQFAMPMAGWICVHTIAEHFIAFQKIIPWIAFILLFFIGVKMIVESCLSKTESSQESEQKKLTLSLLLVQGTATSIDALSVGFTIAECRFLQALSASTIIAAVTFLMCITGLALGKNLGTKFSKNAEIIGGIILIGIGIQIVLKHYLV